MGQPGHPFMSSEKALKKRKRKQAQTPTNRASMQISVSVRAGNSRNSSENCKLSVSSTVASWLSVARCKKLRMRGVHHAHRLCVRGASSYMASYVYLQPRPHTRVRLHVDASGAVPMLPLTLLNRLTSNCLYKPPSNSMYTTKS